MKQSKIRRKLLGLLALSFSALPLFAQSNLDKAQTAFIGRNYPEAVQYYELALQEGAKVDALDAQASLAKAYQFCGKFQKAEEWYARVVKDPAVPHIYIYYYAEMLKSNGKFAEARQVLEGYARQQPELAKQALRGLDFAEKNRSARSAFRVAAEGINSSNSDFAPAFYGDKLVFSSSRVTPMKAFGGNSDGRLSYWYSCDISPEGILRQAKPLESTNPIEVNNNLAPLAISQTAGRIAVSSHQFLPGIRHFKEMFRTMGLEIHGGSKLEAYSAGDDFPHFQNMPKGFPALSADGQILYFSAMHPSGVGGFDLYMSRWENGRWSVPMNLGPEVNTIGDEVAPYIAADGHLYFSSDFQPGFGGFDVFRAEWQEGAWVNVRNLGAEVNSNMDDMYFIFDSEKKMGYFSSNRAGGLGDYDIYSAKFIGPEAALALVSELIVVKPEVQVAPETPNPPVANNNPFAGATESNPFAEDNPDFHVPAQPAPGATAEREPRPAPKPGPIKTPTPPATKTTPAQPTTPKQPATTNPGLSGGASSGTMAAGSTELPCALNFYVGAIVDAQTNQPLEGVMVFLRNDHKRAEAPISFMSNRYGEYACTLDPMTTYTLALSKPGYENEVFSLQTETGGRKTLLGTRAMRRSATSADDIFAQAQPAPGPMPGMQSRSEDPVSVAPVATPVERRFSMRPNAPVPAEAFQVQVANVASMNEEMMNRLSAYGHVLSEPNGKLKRYTLGLYAERKQADEVLAEVRKMGFKDAFIRPQKLDANNLSDRLAASNTLVYPLQVEAVPAPAPVEPKSTKTAPASDAGPFAGTGGAKASPTQNWADNTPRSADATLAEQGKVMTAKVEFKVQLAALRVPEGSDFSALQDLGKIEQQLRTDGLTAIYLGGFATVQEAQRASAAARQRGYKDAFVIALRDGQRINMAEALK